MKKRITKILYASLVLILILLSSCGESHHNALVYRYELSDEFIPIDSLKKQILSDPGITMLVSYADSDVVIIHYDRFRTHQERIETRFTENGYTIRLLEKHAVNNGEQPWQKK